MLKRILLGLLVMVPIVSISFAAQAALRTGVAEQGDRAIMESRS